MLSRNLGFTLVEMLVVLAIIAIIAAVSGIGMRNSFESARDAQRKSDLRQYQTALERQANNNNGFYESRTTAVDAPGAAGTLCADLVLTSCPVDPRRCADTTCTALKDNTWIQYTYISDGTGPGNPTGRNYVLWARLENVTTTTYWEICSNGKSGTVTTAPTNSTCDL